MSALLLAAHEFVDAVVPELEEEGVLPVSRYHTQLRVGHDYFGDTIRGVAEYSRFVEALNETFSERFSEDKPLGEREFASRYTYDYLEAVISACASNYEKVSSDSIAIHNVDLELLRSLQSNQFDIVVCSKVKHMATETGNPIDIGDIRVTPIPSDHTSFLEEIRVLQEIPRLHAVLRDGPPNYFAQPLSMVVTEGNGTNQMEVGESIARRIGKFILAVRLLTASSTAGIYEIRGSKHHIGCYDPEVYELNVNADSVQRTAVLRDSDAVAVENVLSLIEEIENENSEAYSTPLVTAMRKFSATYRQNSWDNRLVDLITALEAALCDSIVGELSLRVRLRAASLLSTDMDSASNIFDDIGSGYELRSKFVHGANIKRARVEGLVTGMARGFEEPVGTSVLAEVAVDRLRDIVRRAILARMCLAYRGTRPWPINPDFGADAKLIDEEIRDAWNSHWHTELRAMGANDAIEGAGSPKMFYHFD